MIKRGDEFIKGSPVVWIIYENEKYEGAQVYLLKRSGLISTHTFTDEDDYVPDLEMFVDSENSMLYTEEGAEWTRFERRE